LFLEPGGSIGPKRYGYERQHGTETVGFDTDAVGRSREKNYGGLARAAVWYGGEEAYR
jgi:hypothetical protein